MALQEGLKGFVDFITRGFNGDGDDAFTDLVDYSDDDTCETDGTLALDSMYGDSKYGTSVAARPARSFERESKVTTHPNSYKSGEVMVIEPRSFSESAQIVRKLVDKKTVILHLDLLDKEQSQRTIDFVCGASHALNGTAQKISDMVFIFAPSNISLSIESSAVQNKFTAEPFWNKPQ